MPETVNVDAGEIARFQAAASRWWDPEGEMRPLHDLNPVRLDYVERAGPLAGRRIIDVGCGGGLLAEAMARRGARVTGLDLASELLQVAELHALESGIAVDYRLETAEQHAVAHAGTYDVATCMEMLEHVPDPRSVLAALAQLVRPGGQVFVSTINRTPQAYLHAVIVGAEYVLRLVAARHPRVRTSSSVRPELARAWGGRGTRDGRRRRRSATTRSRGRATLAVQRRRRELPGALPAASAARTHDAARMPPCSTSTARCSTRRRTWSSRSTGCATEEGREPLPAATIRPVVSHGATAVVTLGVSGGGDGDEYERHASALPRHLLTQSRRRHAALPGADAVLGGRSRARHALGHRDQQAGLADRAAARDAGPAGARRLRA